MAQEKSRGSDLTKGYYDRSGKMPRPSNLTASRLEQQFGSNFTGGKGGSKMKGLLSPLLPTFTLPQ